MKKYLVSRWSFVTSIGFVAPIVVSVIVMRGTMGEIVYPGDFIVNVIFGAILILLVEMVPRSKLSFVTEVMLMIMFNLLIFIKTSHVYLFNTFFSRDSVYHLLQTNKSESTGFMKVYFDNTLGLLLFVFIIIIIIFSFLMYAKVYKNWIADAEYKGVKSNKVGKRKYYLILITVLILMMTTYIRGSEMRRYYFLPYTFLDGYYNFHKDLEAFKNLGNDRFGGDFSNVIRKENDSSEVIVLVLGESTSRDHMGLYNYYRETNPLLNKIKDEIYIYKDVISPNPNSIQSLSKILTVGDSEFPEKRFNGSILQLFNKAGYETYWISTQQKSGINDTFTTNISNSCKEQYFIASYDRIPLDGELIRPFNDVLKNGIRKKLIVIHMLGTHQEYYQRYPKSFDIFHTKPEISFDHDEAKFYTNTYDNAVLYNDYVMNKIIKSLKKSNINSTMVYLSDHGEEVYDSMDLSGHWEETTTKAMYDIPFLIWFSDNSYKDSKKLTFDFERAYVVEDLIYTLSDLAGIQFDEFDSEKSIVNKNFKAKKRILKNNMNYDEKFIELDK